MKRVYSYFLFLLVLISACSETKENKRFRLLSPEETGVDFQNNLSSTTDFNIIEYLYFYNGGGVATADFNNDGLVDIFFTGNQVSNELYFNRGNLKFEKATESAGLKSLGEWSTGVTTADVNGDGLLDIYVCQVTNYKGLTGGNKLYINQGDETFLDLAEYYGVDFQGLSTHAAFFDYDRDGDLDLYLLNHSVKSPEVFTDSKNRVKLDSLGDKLYMNLAAQGNRGFKDVTEASGIYSSVLGFGLGVNTEDFNGDGWLDIYVSNDFTENDYLYLNQKDGTFKESLEGLIANTSRYSMGNDAADLNGDGLPEIFTTDMLPEDPEIWMKSVGEDKQEVYSIKKRFGYADQFVRNNLQINRGQKGFSEVGYITGVEATDWSWSPLLVDLDNDGNKDIHITNGIVKRPNDLDFIQYSQEAPGDLTLNELRERQIAMLPTVKLSNFTFQSSGNMKFENVSEVWGLDEPSYSNGSAYADLDNDGDLDLVINNLDQPNFIYENQSEKDENSFLSIDLAGGQQNILGLGSKVTLFANGKKFAQRLSSSRGFQSGSSSTLIFGLGKVQRIDSIQVDWSNGVSKIYPSTAVNQKISLSEMEGSEVDSSTGSPIISAPTLPWKHEENQDFDEWDREYLLPRSFANLGPALAVGDVDGDGDDDLYFGGAKGQAGVLFLKDSDGNFSPVSNPIFEQLAKAEDVAAEFADFNGDGVLDLYVASGGNELESGNLFLFDRVYFGDGKGGFQFSPNSLPPLGENSSSIAINDIDQDGDLDIFVGVSVTSGDYGANPNSYLLINQGNGRFSEETQAWFGNNLGCGMVNSASWSDLNQDGKSELILSGDWQGIRIFEQGDSNRFFENQVSGLELSAGWIQDILVEDFNNDGLFDIAVGNLGLNTKLKASPERPAWLYHSDFDQNGQNDPIIFRYMQEHLVPFGSRDDLIQQIASLKGKHSSYEEYSKIQSPSDLFTKEQLDQSSKYPAYNFQSGVYFQKKDGSFSFEAFPWQAQLSPIISLSWNKESSQLILGGNLADLRVDLGDTRANSIMLLKRSDIAWEQDSLPYHIPLHSEIRHASFIDRGKEIVALENNGAAYLIPFR